MHKQRLYILVISIIGMLAALMPWVSMSAFGSLSYNVAGTNGDGKLTLALFAGACALCFIGNKKEKFEQNVVYGLWGIGGLNLLIFFILIMNFNKAVGYSNRFSSINIAHGAYLTLLAAVGLIAFSVEQWQLVDKVDRMISRKKNVVSSTNVEPVKEEVVVSTAVNVSEKAEVSTQADQTVELEQGISEHIADKDAKEILTENSDQVVTESKKV